MDQIDDLLDDDEHDGDDVDVHQHSCDGRMCYGKRIGDFWVPACAG